MDTHWVMSALRKILTLSLNRLCEITILVEHRKW